MGRAIASRLVLAGCTVAAVARRKDLLAELERETDGRAFAVEHDVKDIDEVERLFMQVTDRLGGLDLVVYAAGVMPEVGPDEYDLTKDEEMVRVNYLGAVAWLNCAAARFAGVGHGTIIGIGSLAGDRGRANRPVYNSSKAALAAYLEALRNRLWRRGVVVCTVKPGPTRTPMTQHLDLGNAPDADWVAEQVLRRAKNGELYLKPAHRLAMSIFRLLPSWLFRRLKV
jgi:NAD(P)-dependent dehydrogenase (short-subunit alcohol dehydrogenase family)